MISKGSRTFIVILVLFNLFPALWAQTAGGTKCPAVKPKNAQEAVMIEQSSDKHGCWVRDKSGQLVFVSSAAPDQYKRLVQMPASTTRPTCAALGGAPAAPGVMGTWLLDWKCVANCEGVRGTDNGSNSETITIDTAGPKLFQMTFGSYPEANACMVPVQLNPIGQLSSGSFVTASGSAHVNPDCGTAPSFDVENRGATLFVRMRRIDIWEGTACRTKLGPGAWIPTYPGKGYWMGGGKVLP